MEDENNVEEAEEAVTPPVPSRPDLPAPGDEDEEDAAADDRTSPSPYAEKFDEWVADETAATNGRQHRRDTDSRDAAT